MTDALTSIAGGAGKLSKAAADKAAAAANPALAKAAHAFEAVFLRQMIGSMRQAKLGDELFGSSASDQFRDMSDARLADDMAGKFGIAAMLTKQLAGKAGAGTAASALSAKSAAPVAEPIPVPLPGDVS